MRLKQFLKRWGGVGLVAGLMIIISALIVACTGPSGSTGPAGSPGPGGAPGPAGSPGVSTGTVSGKVTNSLTKAGVAGAKVVTDPVIQGVNITTDNSGSYSATLPIGVYKLNLTQAGYTAVADSVSVVAGQTITKDISLVPTSKVAVSAGAAQTAAPGANVALKATVTPLDGSAISGYEWTQVTGIPITLANNKTDSLNITLPNASVYKAEILKGLELLDRVEVKGINPHALSAAEISTFRVTVTTSSGKYSANVNVTAQLPYEFTTGLASVPQGVPVLLNGKQQASYNWTVVAPPGSKAALVDSTTRNPVLTPDVNGKYTVTESVSKASLDVYAGTWAGTITGQDASGRPLSAGCTGCHDGKTAADKFTPWAKSGHAEIFTQNINDPAGHWAITCAGCHTVGYDPAVTNGGFDEAMASEGWKVPPHGDVGLWTQILASYPKTAKLANIQCENCHGPNNGSTLHANGKIDPARVSLSADVCGSCHGEPPRHGRFQQWEESGHGNYELAIDESGSASCARCHTAQGFLTWIKQGDLTKQIQGKAGNATAAEMAAIVTKDTAQPQTCVVCHDPHAQGTTSSEPNTATVRIVDNTLLLPAGFKAEIVGKGALCITCHNTRNAVHNGDALPTSYSAPHTAAQGDVLMGENAYFVPVGARSPHSLIENTCVTCHLNESPPPAEYSMNLGGTNHGFVASVDICGKCHSDTLNGEALQDSVEAKIEALGAQMSKYLMVKLPENITVKDYTPHTFSGASYDVKSDAVVIAKGNIVSLEPTEPHGQQGFIVKLRTPVTVNYKPAAGTAHSLSLSELEVQLGDFTTNGTNAILQPTDKLVQAGWNYFLIHGDASKGVHNPGFSIDVLDASIVALK